MQEAQERFRFVGGVEVEIESPRSSGRPPAAGRAAPARPRRAEPGRTGRRQTAETDRYLRTLVPPDGDRRPIPSGAYNVAVQLLAVEAGVDDHLPSARVHLSGGAWLTLRAARFGDDPSTGEQDIAVTIEATSPGERTAVFARACGLSARETELLSHLVSGSDTHRIAQEMFLSEHTVQDHLKSIFAKTGTRNRRTLLARSAGR